MPILNPEHAYREFLVNLPEGERFEQHHIKARKADISRYCLIPGSHLRGRLMAERLDDCRVVSATRGYYVYSGTYQGVFVTICSTGMGGPVVAIAMEELGKMGVNTFIRVGSAGTLQDFLGVGDIVVATAANRAGGTSFNYLPGSFPAVANFDVTRELVAAADRLQVQVHTGVCTAGDAFYAPEDQELRPLFKQAGVLALEMESDTAFIVSQFRGWRCGAAFVLDGGPARPVADSSAVDRNIADHASNDDFRRGEAAVISVALEAMVRLATRDANDSHAPESV